MNYIPKSPHYRMKLFSSMQMVWSVRKDTFQLRERLMKLKKVLYLIGVRHNLDVSDAFTLVDRLIVKLGRNASYEDYRDELLQLKKYIEAIIRHI